MRPPRTPGLAAVEVGVLPVLPGVGSEAVFGVGVFNELLHTTVITAPPPHHRPHGLPVRNSGAGERQATIHSAPMGMAMSIVIATTNMR